MYTQALEVGLMPSEFWALSVKEARDIITARITQKSNEIYSLSNMIRLAVLSVFSPDVQFPQPPQAEGNENKWKNSKNFMKQLQQAQRGCKNK